MNPRQMRAFRALEIGPPLLARAVESDKMTLPSPAEPAPGSDPISGMTWAELTDSINTCSRCSLCETRTNAVPGNGSMPARWVVVGEAPGRQEDQSGEPFVGAAGKLLDAMLTAAGTGRDRGVFVINTVKCRPPDNRDPSAQELASCRPYLLRQLELLAPALIMTVGRISAQTILGTTDSIGSLRGKVHLVGVGGQQIPLVVSYHPAYFLRMPEEKLKGWQDLCLAMATSPLASTDSDEAGA